MESLPVIGLPTAYAFGANLQLAQPDPAAGVKLDAAANAGGADVQAVDALGTIAGVMAVTACTGRSLGQLEGAIRAGALKGGVEVDGMQHRRPPARLGNTEYSSSFGANQTRTKTPTDNKNRLSRSSETENGFGAKTATETETENCDGHATYVRRRPPGGLLGTCEGRGGLKLISTSCRSHAPRRFQSDHAHGFRNHGVHG